MSGRTLRLLMAGLALAGLGIASYLVYTHYSGTRIACSTGGCETVQQSAYADIFGIPVALLGLLAYAAMLLSVLRDDLYARAATVAVAIAGAIFAVYLVIVQLAVVDAVCQWCMASDALTVVLAALALWRVRPELAEPVTV
jgi:uncharacterized membrane protein